MFLVNWSLGLLFKRIIRSLEKLIVVRVWVSSKRWVRSHVVTGGFFGKLQKKKKKRRRTNFIEPD